MRFIYHENITRLHYSQFDDTVYYADFGILIQALFITLSVDADGPQDTNE